jgi:adenine-specific DNA-methyltransferase
MFELTKTKRASCAKLDKLRLLVAQEIIRNGLNTFDHSSHIQSEMASSELCEQYSLRMFLYWLATKYGLPVCASSIQPAEQPAEQAACQLPGCPACCGHIYPFYSYFDSLFDEQLRIKVFNYLDEHFSGDEVPALELAGDLYMRTLGARRGGEFYTAPEVVDYCLVESRWHGDATLLDPACGTGNFLLGALRRTENKVKAVENLYGYDIDFRAISIARVLLLFACAPGIQPGQAKALFERIACNVIVADSTAIRQEDKFDIVIGNPPYISFGARNQPPMPPSLDRFLRLRFPSSSQYKIRLHSVFQEISLRLVRNDGDVVLLLPDAFLTGAFYSRLRELITAQSQIVSLTELPETTFSDAIAGRWCIAHYRKRLPHADGDTQPVSLRSFNDVGQEKRFQMNINQLVSADKHRFRLLFNNDDLEVMSRLDELPLVKSLYRGHTGMRARHGQRSIVADSRKGPQWKRGIASGARVKPHVVDWTGDWLHVKPENLFAGGFDPFIIENPKVLVRQTADHLIGSLDGTGLYHLNNVHSFAPINTATDAAFFAALLNSRLWLYVYQLKSREKKRALAQIDIEMVESLPLPRANPSLEKMLAATVHFITGDASFHSRDQIISAIDTMIYQLYELSLRQIQHIESTIGGRPTDCPLLAGDEAANLLESLTNNALG